MDGNKAAVLGDTFGRTFPYLRLSVTKACNFRCAYCLPEGHHGPKSMEPLSVDEIRRLVTTLAGLGVRKVRLSGGEATVRPDFEDIARCVASLPGIDTVALTTNGFRLGRHARRWQETGITHINVSLDSLDRTKLARITGRDCLPGILAGLDSAEDAGFKRIKVNTVLLRDVNDDEVDAFLALAQHRPLHVRFIELMRTRDNGSFFDRHHLRSNVIATRLERQGWTALERAPEDGPAVSYTRPGFAGTVGLIAPYERGFCKSCNRLRITAQGELRLCLFAERSISLRHLLQDDSQMPLLEHLIVASLTGKPEAHGLQDNRYGDMTHLASVGG